MSAVTMHHFSGLAAPFVRSKGTVSGGVFSRNEEKLRATMTDEQKELFEKYTNCMREYQTTTDCLIFQNSFKLGARMMLEVMEDR